MAEGQRGRPKKHPHEDHHYRAQEQVALPEASDFDVIDEVPTGLVQAVPDYPLVASSESPPMEGIISNPPAPEEVKIPVSQPILGWKPIETAPHNGLSAVISETAEGTGIVAFWRRTRAFIAKRWQETGHWCDSSTGLKVTFVPQYWKERP